jgi:hypothetical protein
MLGLRPFGVKPLVAGRFLPYFYSTGLDITKWPTILVKFGLRKPLTEFDLWAESGILAGEWGLTTFWSDTVESEVD